MIRLFRLLVAIAAATLLLGGLVHAAGFGIEPEWTRKVDRWVLETMASDSQTEFLVFLGEQADLSPAEKLATKEEKGAFVYEHLRQTAERSQPAVISSLRSQGAEFRSFWIANMIWVKGDASTLKALALRPDVSHIYANPAVQLQAPYSEDGNARPEAAAATLWNLLLVGAPDLWTSGFTGQGIVIGGQDTGYDWDHPALINQYNGWNGITATHDYNWRDAIHTSGGSCLPDSPEPCDDNGHGTHTMGTMVGEDSAGNRIGMAPGARWIGCRNMKQGWGTPATYAECYQWFIAPTKLNGLDADPSKAPHVINNSWACPPAEGCTDPNVLLTVVDNVRAAGILTVHSAGNEGPACGTIQNPAAIYDASFTVGATSANDTIASFSSRGPVTVDGSNRLKPDITAPGVSIWSSIPGTGYGFKSGTSMAGPHVAGLVALLLSAEPGLAGQVTTIEDVIRQNAVPLRTTQGCGGDTPTSVPNHVYGHGRMDALAAYTSLSHKLEVSAVTASQVVAGRPLTYTFLVTHTHFSSPTANVILSGTLPAGTRFFTATQPHTFDGRAVTWTIGSLGASETRLAGLTVVVPVTASGTITMGAYSVRSDDVPVPVPGMSIFTRILTPALTLRKSAPPMVQPGEVFTYRISVDNDQLGLDTHQVLLTDTLPAFTEFVTATRPHLFDGRTISWSLPLLSAGGSWQVDLVVRAAAPISTTLISNGQYGVRSSETPYGQGDLVVTWVRSRVIYFYPVFLKDQ